MDRINESDHILSVLVKIKSLLGGFQENPQLSLWLPIHLPKLFDQVGDVSSTKKDVSASYSLGTW